jgi:REP element-mobilizing transposase RayT
MGFPNRRLNRCAGYDYAAEGAYFVTTCVRDRLPILATIVEAELQLTLPGRLVQECWEQIGIIHAKRVTLDVFAVMPDHFHGVVFLNPVDTAGETTALSTIIGGFKAASAKAIRRVRPEMPAVWQRSFHDRVIRSDAELTRIRRYVNDNPARWVADIGNS